MDLLSALGTVAGKGLHILELWVLAAPWDEVYGRVQALRAEAVSEKTGQERLPWRLRMAHTSPPRPALVMMET